jgi:hypothetical protein
MTGTPHIDHDESNGAGAGGRPKGGFPWQLGLSVAAWIVLGALMVVSALNQGSSGGSDGADQGSVDQIQSQLGSSSASTGGETGHPTVLLLLGFVALVMALLLLIGQGWARYALAVIAVIAVVLFALNGRLLEAVASFLILVVGSVPLLAPSAHRYLTST